MRAETADPAETHRWLAGSLRTPVERRAPEYWLTPLLTVPWIAAIEAFLDTIDWPS